METLSLEAARKRLGELLSEVVNRPDVAPEMAADLHRVFYALRDHVYYLGYQKRVLDELRAELDSL